MRFGDLLNETYASLTANKTRSFLTILGIMIGIGSVVAMIAFGQGATASIEGDIQALGSNLLIISPGSKRAAGSLMSGRAETLILEDAEAIEDELEYIYLVSSDVNARQQVTANGENVNISIYGVTPSYAEIKNVNIDSGSFISDTNVKQKSKIAIIGQGVREDLFGIDTDPLGEKLRIGNDQFTIIGMLELGSSDDLVYIPISTAQHYMMGSDALTTVNVQVTEEEYMKEVELAINDLLLERHNITDPNLSDFRIMNQADIMETMSTVTDTLTLLLGAIAGISLLVGGIGIMNMMLTTVTERTREIGLRKSLGAKAGDITMQFLTEAIVLTFVGGVIGILLAWGLAYAAERFAGMQAVISLDSIIFAFGISAIIGIVFGYYPARRASKLNPIEALRYE